MQGVCNTSIARRVAAHPKERMLAIRGGLQLGARIWGDEDEQCLPEVRSRPMPCTAGFRSLYVHDVLSTQPRPVFCVSESMACAAWFSGQRCNI